MSVKLVMPGDAAAKPSHPDHSRWVKEKTLAVEAQHVHAIGGTFRDAETANQRNLERLDARNRERKPKAPAKKPDIARRELTRDDLKAAGLRKQQARVAVVAPYRCKHCGVCRRCKRELRVADIMRRNRLGEAAVTRYANALAVMVLAHGMRRPFRDGSTEFPFDRLEGAQRDKALVAATERILDASAVTLGAWR